MKTELSQKDIPILVVDDEPDQALFIRDTLRQTRIPLWVHAVESGEEAIAYISGKGKFADREKYPFPLLVLLDLRMPGIGGFGVLRWVGANPAVKQNLNLVVLSAAQSCKEVEVVYELGAQLFWSKSDSNALQDRVRVWHETWTSNNREQAMAKNLISVN
ncbi:MAG TPA: response regulator [Verrucomicrobiae bacterium]|nr:response regulator [Verrucomicrobiae bacterium]